MNYNVGRFIAQKRKELKYTQQYMAEKLGVSFHGPVIIGLN